MILKRKFVTVLASLIAATASLAPIHAAQAADRILNVSYDPTREFYREYNQAFSDFWKKEKGTDAVVRTTHGGSGSQARSVIEGLNADVVTLALEADINEIAERTGKIPENWRGTLAHNNAPYTSTIVFLVRKGNPQNIKDWGDLTRSDVKVITPNPKTSGGARWNFLAALAWARKNFNGDEEKARQYVRDLYRNVPVLDTGARGSTLSFTQRGLGDVLLAWENEAIRTLEEKRGENFEIVVPSISILAEPPVALVDGNVDKNGTREIATAYLQHLYSQEGQSLAAKYGYRPSNPELVDKTLLQKFPPLTLVKIEDFGGWKKAQAEFFNEGSFFDQIFSGNQ
ncbi:sulfate ABC transporter substrate-binding protein [Bartonella sp. HY329]|nr:MULTISPECIES: sulfate ABC transporter substrate-binding protein [unclassified Bartonella]UXM94454.1 sulfate ABC transporter substrate-binding protein [Bartonella sp. HY329]UXN08778.1 sulfate ABC transporter substrate-binding protein [Bartonella sp. HY328]